MLSIIPLTEETLQPTIELTNSVFPIEAEKGWPETAYKAFLGYEKEWNDIVAHGTDMCRYWVMLDGQKVAGTVGLYHLEKNPSFLGWLGWFCVSPQSRGHGVGGRLLSFAIDEARKLNYDSFWLYTSADPNEQAAQLLYEKMGFKIQYEEEDDEPYKTLFRMKDLQ